MNSLKPTDHLDYIISIGDCCVTSELCTANEAHSESLGAGLIFDWAESNLECVCDITEHGFDWYMENIVNGDKIYETPYRFKQLFYHHHSGNKEYMKVIGERYFSILQQADSKIVFLYMSKDMPRHGDLLTLDAILRNKYDLKYKIVAAISSAEDKYVKISDHVDLFECISPAPFYGNKMRCNADYPKIFKMLIPYNLDNLKLI
jgi:hypothetical protein